MDGTREGPTEGPTVGFNEGTIEGTTDGAVEGATLGFTVGSTDGVTVGNVDGTKDGATLTDVGIMVGSTVKVNSQPHSAFARHRSSFHSPFGSISMQSSAFSKLSGCPKFQGL